MEIITGTKEFYLEVPAAAAIGKFDGIHVGHRKLLAEILEQKKKKQKACVFTFDPEPSVYFGRTDGKELTTREEKRKIFEFIGVDVLVEYPMDKETASMPPQAFVSEILAGRLNITFLAAGYDVSFGAGGRGDAALLQRMAAENGYEVKIIEKVCFEGKEVSSTYVREEVEKGNMKLAGRLLGMPYTVSGQVLHGNRLGRTLGMPTVNLLPSARKLLPPNGVYYSAVQIDGRTYAGVSNIGYKPTVEEAEKRLGVETYIYDFDEEVYGRDIDVCLYEFRRPEKKFQSVEQLREQLERDVKAGREYMKAAF